MRVVSLVPSWTETLLECGVDVVGRTRFCIHPEARVKSIPAVGGTKDWELAKIEALQPDLLILDQEENPKWMSEKSPCRSASTHVTSSDNVGRELEKLARLLNNEGLESLGRRWRALEKLSKNWDPSLEIPGLIEWGRPATEEVAQVVYVIWKAPWMTVSKGTFIGSVLTKLGFGNYLLDIDGRYPEINLGALDPSKTLVLFSSEPFPFLKIKTQIGAVWQGPYAFVDGESFSWFGIRSLKFLERELISP